MYYSDHPLMTIEHAGPLVMAKSSSYLSSTPATSMYIQVHLVQGESTMTDDSNVSLEISMQYEQSWNTPLDA